jgi:uncharacterized protein with PIN domain
MPLLTRGRVWKLRKLLPMYYKVAEIAEALGVTVETIYRTYLPAGMPFVREGKQIWIVGTEANAWARAYLTGKILARKMAADEAWCMTCNRPVKMINPRVMEVDHTHLARIAARCGICGKKLSRMKRRNDAPEID